MRVPLRSPLHAHVAVDLSRCGLLHLNGQHRVAVQARPFSRRQRCSRTHLMETTGIWTTVPPRVSRAFSPGHMALQLKAVWPAKGQQER